MSHMVIVSSAIIVFNIKIYHLVPTTKINRLINPNQNGVQEVL